VVDAATISVVASRVNGIPLPSPVSSVNVQPLDIIEVDLMAGGWGTNIDTVKICQVTLDLSTMIDQSGPVACGSVKPLNYDDPILAAAGWFINTDSLQRGVCAEPSVDLGASCVSTNTLCTGSTCVDGICAGGPNVGEVCATQENQCNGGACVTRPDFIMADFNDQICATSTWPFYRLGCTLLLGDGLADDGAEHYLGTVLLEVGAEAKGTFTLNIDGMPYSFLSDPNFIDAPLTRNPLTIHLPDSCTTSGSGACCDRTNPDPLAATGVCTNNVAWGDCQGPDLVWTQGQTCSQVECAATLQAIPTVSEWGLVLLTLLLLVGAKIRRTKSA